MIGAVVPLATVLGAVSATLAGLTAARQVGPAQFDSQHSLARELTRDRARALAVPVDQAA